MKPRTLRWVGQSRGRGAPSISLLTVSVDGCRPLRIAAAISGASQESLSTRVKYRARDSFLGGERGDIRLVATEQLLLEVPRLDEQTDEVGIAGLLRTGLTYDEEFRLLADALETRRNRPVD